METSRNRKQRNTFKSSGNDESSECKLENFPAKFILRQIDGNLLKTSKKDGKMQSQQKRKLDKWKWEELGNWGNFLPNNYYFVIFSNFFFEMFVDAFRVNLSFSLNIYGSMETLKGRWDGNLWSYRWAEYRKDYL